MDSAEHPSSITSEATASKPTPERVSLAALFRVFFVAGAVSFGGGVIAYLREYVVTAHQWLDDDNFLDALELSETLPGLNSVNMSVIIGDRLRGAAGAAAAVAGLIIPGAAVVLTLAVLWDQDRHSHDIRALLIGIAAAAVGLLLTVTIQLGHKQFARLPDLLFMVATFLAVSVFKFSLLTVLFTIGPLAVWYYRPDANAPDAHRFQHLRDRMMSHRARWRH
jgi:chromate transporter